MGYTYEDEDIKKESSDGLNMDGGASLNMNAFESNNNQNEEVVDNNIPSIDNSTPREEVKTDESNKQEDKFETQVTNVFGASSEEKTEATKTTMNIDDLMSGGSTPEEDLSNVDSIEDLSQTKVEELISSKDEKYFEMYIKQNYEKLTTKSWNWASFFFGPSYYAYRKMYLISILLWVIETLLSVALLAVPIIYNAASMTKNELIVKFVIWCVATLIYRIYLGFSANGMYLNHVGTKIANYKIDKENLEENCKKNGGRSLLSWLIVYMIGGFIISAMSNAIYSAIIVDAVLNQKVPQQTEYVPEEEEVKIEVLGDKKFDIGANLDVLVPYNFEDISKDKHKIILSYSGQSVKEAECLFEIERVTNYDSAEMLINTVKQYKDLENSVETAPINNLMWYTVSNVGDNKTIIYAATLKNENVIFIKYKYNKDMEDICSQSFGEALYEIR